MVPQKLPHLVERRSPPTCDGSDGNLATNHRKLPWQNGLYRDDDASHAAVLPPMAHSQNARAAAIAAQ
jgi:hypothetical protein